MIQISAQMRILVAVEPVDFRCGIDALAALCRQRLKADPFCAETSGKPQGQAYTL
jgi:transposase